jgi:glucose/mannose-6-phosphate isomerase
MNLLDNPKQYQQIDEQDLYGSLAKMGRQFESGWSAAQFVSLGFDPDKIKNIVFVGMGGSNLAGYIAHSLAPFLLSLPFEIVANYRLPSYANKSTLVILSSYSGNIEEVLSCAQDAEMRGCRSLAITSGGQLQALALSKKLPLILLDGQLNPSSVPRAGLGLSLGAVISLLVRLNPISERYFNQKEIIHTIDRVLDMVNRSKDQSDNPAKTLAAKHKGQGIIFFAANHLLGVAKSGTNYLHETAKAMSTSFSFPDLNHHLLEGFAFPMSLKDQQNILILNSSLYPEVIQKRVTLTREILLQQKYLVTVIKPESIDAVSQAFESLVFLIMFSYYLSMANKINPTPTPWVDYLKTHLKT